MIKIKIKKIIFATLALAGIFFVSAGFAKAIRIPSPSQVASELEQRYHIDISSMQDMSESFNVSSNKSTVPQVMVSFSPDAPREGEKITAQAIPMYFTNPSEKLYYTWYLKHDGCGLKNNVSGSEKEECDKNGDGDITVDDWKIEAMHLIATSGYNNLDEPRADYNNDSDSDGYKASLGGDDKSSVSSSNKYCYVHDFESGVNSEMVDSEGNSGCEHLFPEYPNDYHCDPLGENVDLRGNSVGNNSFGHNEECFWGTNPQDPNTAGNGNLDEANVAGLGQDKLSWIYQRGDQVGVAIEGTSMLPTKYEDGSYMIMWALPKNKCIIETARKKEINCAVGVPICVQTEETVSSGLPAFAEGNSCVYTRETPYCAGSDPICSVGTMKCFDGTIPEDNILDATNSCDTSAVFEANNPTCVETGASGEVQTGTKSETEKGFTFSIPTTTIDINDCLEDNLVDPAQKTLEKLDVSLSYTPDNPINDSTGDNTGDVLSLISSVANPSQNSSQLYYDWKISIGKNISGDFSNVSNQLVANEMANKMLGLNIPNLNLNLNMGDSYKKYFQDDIGYIKAEVTVKELLPGAKPRIGKGEVIVRVNSTDKKIKAYLTNSIDGVQLNEKDSICDNPATDSASFYNCPVVKNQILQLEVDRSEMSDFSWSVNGTSYSCDSSISSSCSSGNVIFLPILGNEGDIINVKLSAKNMENGKSIELSKSFQIVKPYVKIAVNSGDMKFFWPKILGNYRDLDGTVYPDFSNSEFETSSGMKATLLAEFHPSWLSKTGTLNSQWLLDGEDITSNSVPGEIQFSADKGIGDSYNIEFNSYYLVSNEIRKILKKSWNVSQNDSGGEMLSFAIRAEVVPEETSQGVSIKNPGKLLASIISNFPSQAIFLIRIALIVFIVILISGFALNFSPDFVKNKK
ncbi:MAG: hypothetical protein V1804_04425 [Patescibacteria group bacterium]